MAKKQIRLKPAELPNKIEKDAAETDARFEDVAALLPGLHKQSGGRLDVIVRILNDRMTELRKVQSNLVAMGTHARLLNPAMEALERWPDWIDAIDRWGHVGAKVELDEAAPNISTGTLLRAAAKKGGAARRGHRIVPDHLVQKAVTEKMAANQSLSWKRACCFVAENSAELFNIKKKLSESIVCKRTRSPTESELKKARRDRQL